MDGVRAHKQFRQFRAYRITHGALGSVERPWSELYALFFCMEVERSPSRVTHGHCTVAPTNSPPHVMLITSVYTVVPSPRSSCFLLPAPPPADAAPAAALETGNAAYFDMVESYCVIRVSYYYALYV